MKVLIINGPNLNLLGTREPSVYGNLGFDDYLPILKSKFLDIDIDYFQSNHEGALIDKLHSANVAAIVMNPGGFSHTSIALADAISAIDIPVVEVHISNIYARESFRQNLITAGSCTGVISGFGMDGYRLAIANLLTTVANKKK